MVDPDERTVAFTSPGGQFVILPVDAKAGNLANVADGSTANVTYTQGVTLLNLFQKGSRDTRLDQAVATPTRSSVEASPGSAMPGGICPSRNLCGRRMLAFSGKCGGGNGRKI